MTDWIKVEDYIKNGAPRDRRILLNTTDGITTGYCDLVRGEYITDDLDLRMSDVTHWMPLPEPPHD